MEIWSLRWNKRNFFQVVANELHEEQARRELLENTTSCFDQIQVATTHKIAAVQPPTSHLTNHPSKMNKTLGIILKDKLIIILPTPTHGHTSVGQLSNLYMH